MVEEQERAAPVNPEHVIDIAPEPVETKMSQVCWYTIVGTSLTVILALAWVGHIYFGSESHESRNPLDNLWSSGTSSDPDESRENCNSVTGIALSLLGFGAWSYCSARYKNAYKIPFFDDEETVWELTDYALVLCGIPVISWGFYTFLWPWLRSSKRPTKTPRRVDEISTPNVSDYEPSTSIEKRIIESDRTDSESVPEQTPSDTTSVPGPSQAESPRSSNNALRVPGGTESRPTRSDTKPEKPGPDTSKMVRQEPSGRKLQSRESIETTRNLANQNPKAPKMDASQMLTEVARDGGNSQQSVEKNAPDSARTDQPPERRAEQASEWIDPRS